MDRVLSLLVGTLWLLAVVNIFAPGPQLVWALKGLLAVFVVVSLPRIAGHSRILLTALAAVTLALAAIYGEWGAVPDGIARAAIFPAFLATIVLLRATADQRPEIATARRMFGALDPDRRDSGVVIGTHLIGAVLQVGVFAILAPILGRDASDDERRKVFTAAIRGMSMVPFWSPFIVGMAVASQYLPAVPLWEIMGLGLVLAVFGVLFSFLTVDRNRGIAPLLQALRSLTPIAVPIAIAALVVVGTTALTSLSTLQALIVGLPLPCLAALASLKTGAVRRAMAQTGAGLARIGTETCILAFATTLGMVFEASLPHMGLLDWLTARDFAAPVIILIVIMTMNVAGLAGVHAIVTGTIVLVVFTSMPTGVADLVLMQALLVGWGLCSGISIGSLSVATGAAMFRLPPTRLVSRANIVFVFTLSLLVAGVLAALNTFLTAQ
tara:strand:+ start:990 stop:2306 length:1317 start_codon:yes stop_codon:yes gene_type:complete